MEKIKNFSIFVAVVFVVAFACYVLPEGMKRQAIHECWKAREICTKYWDVHGGDCLECKEAKQCERDGLFDD